MLANSRLLKILVLDSSLWARALPEVQKHWLKRLHGLLTEDEVGNWNASTLVDAGMLDSVMTMLDAGRLAALGICSPRASCCARGTRCSSRST